jgi:hypothetical protein
LGWVELWIMGRGWERGLVVRRGEGRGGEGRGGGNEVDGEVDKVDREVNEVDREVNEVDREVDEPDANRERVSPPNHAEIVRKRLKDLRE